MLIFNKDFGLGTMGDSGGSAPAVIESLSVTPTTSLQTITAPEGIDGYSPVNVSAVTSSIDANITAGNIKSGTTILGVTGNLNAADVITATNNTGAYILAGDKVWIDNEPFYNKNFDIIGSPTIDDETDVVSGFSASNGLLHPNIYSDTATSWEIVIKCTTGTDISSSQAFFAQNNIDNRGIIGFLYNGDFLVYASNNNTSWNIASGGKITTANANTTYWFKYSWNGSTFSVAYSTDGETYTTAQTYSTQPTFIENNVYIGYRACDTSNYWRGSIDLSETYIQVNGQDWWVPSYNKLSDYTIENLVVPKMSQHFTRVNSLFIDNMIASNFSRYNCIQETQHIDFTKPWEFNTAVTLGNYNDNQFIYVASNTTQANVFNAGFLLFAVVGGPVYFQDMNIVGFNIDTGSTLSMYTLYYIKCGWTGSEYYVGVSTDNINYTYATPYSSTTPCQATDATFNLGGNEGWSTYYIHGTIDLSKTYIINNGEVVWSPYTTDSLTGFAKEVITNRSTGEVLTLVEPKYYAYKDILNRYVYCQNIITSTQYYYNLNARSDNAKATSISELTVPSRAKPKSVSNTGAVTFNIMPYYRSEQDDLY